MTEINTFLKFDPELDFEDDLSHYQNTCRSCGKNFYGVKYRSWCKKCFNQEIRPLGKPCLFQNKSDLLSQMGISEDQYNNDTSTNAVVTILLNGGSPLKLLGNMTKNFIRYQKEQKDTFERIVNQQHKIKTDDNNLHP